MLIVMNKEGISAVVATVLIILVTVILILDRGLFWMML